MDGLYLRPAYRGGGLGRRLFQRVAQAAVELGAVKVKWQTPAWNVDASRFYERLGATSQEKIRFTLSPSGCKEILGEPPPTEA